MAWQRRTRNLFDPASGEPFVISRSKIEDFIQCPRCFYLDRRMGFAKPSIPAFKLNSAVDTLLKKEFDQYRALQEPHPLMITAGIEAVPYRHPELDEWRENFKGLWIHDEVTGLTVSGAIDDVWVTVAGDLIVADYKSTQSDHAVTLDGPWKEAYKRQVEVYQWLFRRRGFTVLDRAWFVYANARTDLPGFSSRLEFQVTMLPYDGDASWVDGTLAKALECLKADRLPAPGATCEYCPYREDVTRESLKLILKAGGGAV